MHDENYENNKGKKLNIRNILMSGNSRVKYYEKSYKVSNYSNKNILNIDI